MLNITPRIGQVLGKTTDPSYSFTFTKVDGKQVFGTRCVAGDEFMDCYFGMARGDGTIGIADPFILLADPEPIPAKPSPMKIKPFIGLVLRKKSDPDYTLTITDITNDKANGIAKTINRNDPSAYYPRDNEGLLDLGIDFFVSPAADKTPQDKPMTTPASTPTKWNCYCCGKECFDNLARDRDPTAYAAWCADCAISCNQRGSTNASDEDILALLEKNGLVFVRVGTAERASPTLKNNPKIKVEKDQEWRFDNGTIRTIITDVKDGYATTRSNSKFGKLTPEGFPDMSMWAREWRLVKPAPAPENPIAQVGKTYRRDDGWTIKITGITGTRVQATQIGAHSGWSDGYNHYHFTDLTSGGKMPERWKLVEEKPAEPTKVKMKVGQVWKSDTGISCLITEIKKDRSVSVIRTCNGKTQAMEMYGSVEADGTCAWGYGWKLDQDIDYAKTKVEAGQTWTHSSGVPSVKVSAVKDGYAANGGAHTWGKLTAEGYPDGWATTNNQWHLTKIEKIVPQMKVGQVWKLGKTGIDHKIVGIKNGRLNVLQGKNLKVLSGFGTITSDGFPGSDWGNIKEDGWHIEREESVKVKVGQKWRWIGFDSSIKDQVFTVKSIGSVGEAFMNGTTYVIHSTKGVVNDIQFDNWELVEDVMETTPAKPIIGQVWKDARGVAFRIVSFQETSPNAYHVDLERRTTSGNWSSGYAWDWVNGKMLLDAGKDWVQDLPEVGSIWKREDGAIFRIKSVEDCTTYLYVVLEKKVGDAWVPGYANSWYGEFGSGWTLVENKEETVPVPGQIWKVGAKRFRVVDFRGADTYVKLDLLKDDGSVDTNRHTWYWQNGKFDLLGGKEWILEETKPAVASFPPIGSIWKCGDIRYRVLSIDNAQFRNVKMESFTPHGWMTGSSWTWKDGKFETLYGKEWILEEEKKTYSEPKVGQIWKGFGGTHRVLEIRPAKDAAWDKDIFFEHTITKSRNSWAWKDGNFDSGVEWSLETDAPPTEPVKGLIEPKVGQIWKGYGDETYRIAKIVDASSSSIKRERVYFDRKIGDNWESYDYWIWENGKFISAYPWTLLSDAPPPAAPVPVPIENLPDVKVGQIWDSGLNCKFRIAKIVGNDVQMEHFRDGEFIPGYAWSIENGKWKTQISNHGWTLISEASDVAEIPVKEQPNVEVGQIWDAGDGKTQYRIRQIDPEMAWLDTLGKDGTWRNGGAWYLKDGKWKMPVIPGKEMILLPNKAFVSPPKVGTIWDDGDGRHFRVGSINSPRSNSEDVYVVMERKHGSDWVNTGTGWGWKDGKFNSSYDWKQVVEEIEKVVGKTEEKMENKEKPLLKIGQVWKLTGNRYRVYEFEGSPIISKVLLERFLPETNVWFRGTDWDYVQDGKFRGDNWILEQDVFPSKPAKPTLRQMMGADMANASYRVAANQLTKGAKQALLSLMEKQGHNSSNIKALSELLDTEVGSALVGMALGMGLTYIPQVSNSGRAQRLATEFRTGSMAVAGNVVADAMTEHFIPVITNAFSGLPKEQIRVAASLPAHVGEEVETHEENEKSAQA